MFDCNFFPDTKLCVFTGRGDIAVAQIKTVASQLFDDPAWEPGWDILYDFRGATISGLDYQRMRSAVFRDKSFNGRVKGARVVFVADTDLTYGLMRMWQTMSADRPIEIRVFRRIKDALQFLGVQDPAAIGC